MEITIIVNSLLANYMYILTENPIHVKFNCSLMLFPFVCDYIYTVKHLCLCHVLCNDYIQMYEYV